MSEREARDRLEALQARLAALRQEASRELDPAVLTKETGPLLEALQAQLTAARADHDLLAHAAVTSLERRQAAQAKSDWGLNPGQWVSGAVLALVVALVLAICVWAWTQDPWRGLLLVVLSAVLVARQAAKPARPRRPSAPPREKP